MPVGNAPTRTPRRNRVIGEGLESWAIRVGTVCSTELRLSYNVFIGMAITALLVGLATTRPGDNGDLPVAAATGAAFWVAGWLVQAIACLVIGRSLGLPIPSLTIGILGVESSAQRWTAARTLCVALAAVGSLILLGVFFHWIDGGFRIPVMQRSGEILSLPSIGFSEEDSIWRSGAWLCFFQACFQMYPLPKSQGRLMVGGLTGLCGARLDLDTQSIVFRRCLSAIAALTLLAAVALMASEVPTLAAKWPLVLLLAMLLWASARSGDVIAILAAMGAAREGQSLQPEGVGASSTGMVTAVREAIESRQATRRLRDLSQQEQNEAGDVARLDEILNRVHRDGIDSLDDQDRKILERVSKNLRRRREYETDPDDDRD